MPRPVRRRSALAAAALLAFAAPAALAQTSTPGTTVPSEERKLLFPTSGIVAEVMVKEGDRVSAGQPVMRQDDREEAKRLEALTIAAAVERLKIRAAEKELAQSRVELERSKSLYERKATSEQELQEAQLAVDLAEVRVELAGQEAVGADAQTAVQAIRVDQMTLDSPIDGVIASVDLGAGEFASPDPDRPVLKVVKNDPLYVEVKNLPSARVSRMAVGDAVRVQYPGEGQAREARVIFVAPVGDARSGTQYIKLEMPNPEGRATGLNVSVLVPDAAPPSGAAAAARAGD